MIGLIMQHTIINHTKKTTIMKKTILISLAALVLFSCKKDDKNEPCTISTAAISGSYKITSLTYKENATAPEVDYLFLLFNEPCRRDDVYTFKADGTYILADAGIVCSPSGGDNGTWALVGTTSMQLDYDDATIESFDCKTLVFVIADTDTPGDKLKFTMTRQ
jgi:hypothetical protein